MCKHCLNRIIDCIIDVYLVWEYHSIIFNAVIFKFGVHIYVGRYMEYEMTSNKKIYIILFALIFLISTSYAWTEDEKAADFTLKDINGKSVTLSKLKGKVVLLNFWATWCGPCRVEIPDLISLYKIYKKKGVEFLSVSLDEKGEEIVKPFIKKYKIHYPVLIGGVDIVQSYGGFNSIPTTFMIDKKGYIRNMLRGMQSKKEFEKQILKLLNE